MRVNNSPYVLVRGKQHQQLVREGTSELGFEHNSCLEFSKSGKRPDFIKTMGGQVNENRFCLSDRYDKSTYLTKVSRPKAIINFERETERPQDLIAKGGDLSVRLDGKSQVFYEHDIKD